MTGAVARIFLRYFAMALVMWGWLGPADAKVLSNDPDLAMAVEVSVGILIMGGTELWYWAAKKFGWAT